MHTGMRSHCHRLDCVQTAVSLMGSLPIAVWKKSEVRFRKEKTIRSAEFVKQIVDRGQRDH